MYKFLIVTTLLFSLNHSAEFTVQPSLVEQGGKAIITFAVDVSTDVEVGVLDNSGKVVRHLAAGVLGGSAAAPEPLQAGLSQRLEWDGLDDYGRTPVDGPFNVRVRAGVFPLFERSLPTRVFPDLVSYGPDSVTSVGEVISMSHPLWKSGSTTSGVDTSVVRFYERPTRLDMTVSDETDEILLNPWKSGVLCRMVHYDGSTGKLLGSLPKFAFPIPTGNRCTNVMPYTGEPFFSWDGKYVFHDEMSNCNNIYRFFPNGTPAPWAGNDNVIQHRYSAGADDRGRGFATGPDGTIYYARYSDTTNGFALPHVLAKYDSNGTIQNEKLVTIYGNIGQGVRVDWKGNLYLGVRVKPYRDTVPKAIRDSVSGVFSNFNSAGTVSSTLFWGGVMYGSIVKFPPEGGKIMPDATGNLMGGRNIETRLSATNMTWLHYGASFQASHSGGVGSTCYCYAPRFDVDRFCRVIYPDPFGNRFTALDASGNMMFQVHNRDLLARHNLKVGAGHAVQATDRRLYVADQINNQVVSFTWSADAEATLPVPTLGVEGLVRTASPVSVYSEPNPFGSLIHLRVSGLSTVEAGAVLNIFDASGRRVADLTQALAQGKGSVVWNGTDGLGRFLPNGIYYCRISADGKSLVRALTLMK